MTSKEQQRKAFQVSDTDGHGVIVFANTAVAARRIGANELNIEFECVDSCRRKPEFDKYAANAFVPKEVLLDHGWTFECFGCGRDVDSDLEGWHSHGERERCIKLNPVFEGDKVYCCPSCKSRYERTEAARKALQEKAIADFQRRVLRRFPDAEFVEGRLSQHAYASQYHGQMCVQQIIVRFRFPGMKIGPAEYRYDLHPNPGRKVIGPSAPELFCCNGDREAFEAWASSKREAAA
jgi:hypothetical protein